MLPSGGATALGSTDSPWRNPSRWISDPFGYVFLPRAMLEIGKVLYQDDWTGEEPATPVFLKLPLSPTTARESLKREVHGVLSTKRPDIGLRPLVHQSGRPPAPITFTPDQWTAAREIYQRRYDIALPAWQRYAKVRETVASACRSGELVSAWRPRDGGAVADLPRTVWETEGARLHYRFEYFRIDHQRPFSLGITEQAGWICISRDSLDKLLRRLKLHQPSTAKGESEAIRHLAGKLKQNSHLTRDDALAECKAFGISQRGLRDRVLPRAREIAGLPAKASAGRKRKNPRT